MVAAVDSHSAALRLAGRCEQQQSPRRAYAWYLQAVQLCPKSLPARRGLARILEMLGRREESAEVISQTLELEPADVESLNQLACQFFRAGNLIDAAQLFKQSLETDPGRDATWLHLGCAFVASQQLMEAEECFRRVTQLDEANSDGWLNLAGVLKTQQRVDEAATAWHRASGLLPDEPLKELWPATLCPPVFQTVAEIDSYRERLRAKIDRFRERRIVVEVKDIGAIASPPPLNLPFQGRGDRRLLEEYAAIFGSLEKPGFLNKPGLRRRPAIGFVVTGGHEAIFQRFLGGVLNRLTSTSYDLVVVCQQGGVNYFRSQLTNPAITLLPIPYQFASAVEIIREASFDVLYHWETGTDVTNYFLPICRLAPVQCTSFGNPQTSGMPQIDYFLSSNLYEPPSARQHYTEKLLLMRGLGSCAGRVGAPERPKSREEFGYSAHQNLYVCAQKPQKIHPDFDPILADILQRDEQGIVVLVEDAYGTAGKLLRRRFQSSIPDAADRIRFQPRLSFSDYLSLLIAADVLLDPLHHGGGVTLYDALSLGRPVVTLPGEFARGRYALGVYQKMEMTSLVADSPADYAGLAVQMANEPDFRHSVEGEVSHRAADIFEDTEVVEEYGQIFEQLVAAARGASES